MDLGIVLKCINKYVSLSVLENAMPGLVFCVENDAVSLLEMSVKKVSVIISWDPLKLQV